MKHTRRDPQVGYLDSSLWLPKQQVNADALKAALTYAITGRESVETYSLYEETADHLLVPRAFLPVSSMPFPIYDCRPKTFQRTGITSRIKLDHRMIDGVLQPVQETTQRDALKALMAATGGILQLRCGGGKTVTFLEMVARTQVPTLVIIDNVQLMNQWIGEAKQLLDVPGGLGLIQGPVFDWQKGLVFSTYHTIANWADEMPAETRNWFGLVCWDEGHHVGAPTFQKTATMFPGQRVLLTATPKRPDGAHVAYEAHIGQVVYQNLMQELKAKVVFHQTGFNLSPEAQKTTLDTTGEMHLGLLGGAYARWPEHLALVLSDINRFRQENRKVLVLSPSVDELVNLYTMWELQEWDARKLAGKLMTDLLPAGWDTATVLEKKLVDAYKAEIASLDKILSTNKNDQVARANFERRRNHLQHKLDRHDADKQLIRQAEQVRREYIDRIVRAGQAGMITRRVKEELRQGLTKTCDVIFAISRYGREGLDWPALDTVVATMPFSDRNILQQVMGRATRTGPVKQPPIIKFYVHNVGPVQGMARKLKRHLRAWPADEGGPIIFEDQHGL